MRILEKIAQVSRGEIDVGDVPGSTTERMTEPRFFARVVEVDPFAGTPVEREGKADVIGGITYSIDDETVLCEVDWIDEVPDGDHGCWLAAAAEAREGGEMR